jgi:hypothetical protein
MQGVIQKEFWLGLCVLARFAARMLLIPAGGSDKRVGNLFQSQVVIAPGVPKK